MSREKRKEILSALLGFSAGVLDHEEAHKFRYLSYEEVVNVGETYLAVVPKIVDPEDEQEGKTPPANGK